MEDALPLGPQVPPVRLSPVSEPASIPTLDGWIESLMTCKQLAEVDVQRLCEKVRGSSIWEEMRGNLVAKLLTLGIFRHAKFCRRSPTFSQL